MSRAARLTLAAPPVPETPSFTVNYLEPETVEAEPLPEEFSSSRLRHSLLVLAAVAVAVVAVVVLAPGLASLRERFAGAEAGWLVVAAGLQVLSCASYVLVFRAVFCQRMSWRTSTEIGLSELAANSILSVGGAGGLALGAWILRRGGVAVGHIARRTVAFFLLTSLANVGFLTLGGIALATGALSGAPSVLYGLVPALGGVLLISLALGARWAAGRMAQRTQRDRVAGVFRAVGAGVDEALALLRAHDPLIILGAAGYMLFDVAMLGVCFAAFGNDVPPVGVLLLAYIIGQLGSLIPLPGGIGGVDGALIGTLVIYGVDVTDAAVAVIAYRGLLLSIPALLGLPALAVLRRRLQTEAHDIAACAPGDEVELLGRGKVRVAYPGAVSGRGAAPRPTG
jgi:uncharacterized membrane protein YbhN (UPF0104 family)